MRLDYNRIFLLKKSDFIVNLLTEMLIEFIIQLTNYLLTIIVINLGVIIYD